MRSKLFTPCLLIALAIVTETRAQPWLTNGTNVYYLNGNVGVGITAPIGKFQVYGGNAYLWGLNLGYGTNPAVITTDDNSKSLSLQINNTEYARLQNNGNFGIGTSTPTEKLSVSGNIQLNGKIYWDWTDRTIEQVLQPDGVSRVMRFRNSMYVSDENPNGGFDFADPGGTSVMRIVNGNVSVGTADSKGYRFAVNGDAIFTKVKVKAYPWADYVFQKNYLLRPLSEVEQFIQQYQHLPDMPSAAEVEMDGLDLAGNQALLLKKVEELTLYVIELQKEVDALKKEKQQNENKKNSKHTK